MAEKEKNQDVGKMQSTSRPQWDLKAAVHKQIPANLNDMTQYHNIVISLHSDVLLLNAV